MAGHGGYLVAFLLVIYCHAHQVDTLRCPSYCDENGYLVSPQWCTNDGGGVFCCGTLEHRYCCSNSTIEFPEKDDMHVCPKSAWWLFQWQIALGLLCSVILLLLVAACCCKICMKTASRRGRSRRRHRRSNRGVGGTDERGTISTIVQNEYNPPSSQIFNPESAFAFEPPPYDSLPKHPPAYSSIFDGPGNTNEGFVPDVIELPPYPSQEGTLETVCDNAQNNEESAAPGGTSSQIPNETYITDNHSTHSEEDSQSMQALSSSLQPLTLSMISNGHVGPNALAPQHVDTERPTAIYINGQFIERR